MNQGYDYSSFGESRDSIASYTAKTYGWMFLGLLTTFVAAAAIYFTGFYIPLCTAMNGLLPFVLALVELGVVIYLSARIHKIPVATARLLFFVYALLNAVTFSTILAVYSMQSLILVFAMTSLYFGVMAGLRVCDQGRSDPHPSGSDVRPRGAHRHDASVPVYSGHEHRHVSGRHRHFLGLYRI